ncbi:MAG TPA: hypothetical protein VMU10_04040 [Desulfomonilia bacterium]|nr:hypothetical protein [Desulfomonilia bacterium]
MIRNPEIYRQFEDAYQKNQGHLSRSKSLALVESLWEEAKSLGIFPMKDPWEGIEVDIRIARVLNSCSK